MNNVDSGSVNFDNIPSEPRSLDQWCLYKIELNEEGKHRKVPFQIDGITKAASNDPATWSSFNAARLAFQDLHIGNGPCFMLLKENGIVFIDLDDCIAPDGTIEDWALELVSKFDPYTERSQSGKGLHILIKGVKRGPRCRTAKCPHGIEIYNHLRPCYLTGDVV